MTKSNSDFDKSQERCSTTLTKVKQEENIEKIREAITLAFKERDNNLNILPRFESMTKADKEFLNNIENIGELIKTKEIKIIFKVFGPGSWWSEIIDDSEWRRQILRLSKTLDVTM